MKISIEKLELAKARACMDSNDIIRAGIPKGTYNTVVVKKARNHWQDCKGFRRRRNRTIGRLRKEKRNNE